MFAQKKLSSGDHEYFMIQRILIILIVLLLLHSPVFAQMGTNSPSTMEHYSQLKEPDSCKPSIMLQKQESSYGPPSVPSVDRTNKEYQKRLNSISNNINNSDRLYELAYLAYINGDLDVAEKYFSLSLDVDNYTIPFYKTYLNYYLGRIDEVKGNLMAAQSHFSKLGSSYYMHLIQAKIYRTKGKIESAEHEYLLAQSVKLYEMYNITPYKLLAEMFIDLKNYNKARSYANEYLECAKYVDGNPFAGRGYDFSSSKIKEVEQLHKKIEFHRK